MMRPFVFINSAISADGKISSIDRKQVRISGKEDLQRVDELRAESDAIMVGIGTILADDPRLVVKSESLRRNRISAGKNGDPLRVVVDSRGRTPDDAKVLGDGCIVATSMAAPPERVEQLSHLCEVVIAGEDWVDLPRLLSMLYQRGVRRLMVEGGGRLNWSLVEAGLVDEICVYIGPKIIGGERAPTLIDGAGFRNSYPILELMTLEKLDEGALIRWRII